LNRNAEFCRLNSGATRSSSYYDGAPPPRGEETFLLAEEYENNVGSVAEVTFPNSCQLPEVFHIGDSPQGRWRATSLT